MPITVRFFANFREATGKGQEFVEGVNDVGSLIDELVKRYGDNLSKFLYHKKTRELRSDVSIMVNGKPIRLLRGVETPLKDGDVVAIFPPVAGG